MAINQRRLWLPEMEGAMARWYDRQRGTASQLRHYQAQAMQLTSHLPVGAAVLEVAPGPGYLAIEIARLGPFQVSGLDISRSFVEIASEHARQAGVGVDFQQGDVAAMPFSAEWFDLIICQAAFKNFRQPVTALDEMHRVLKAGGTALIQDMYKSASNEDIAREVAAQGLSGFSAWITRRILGGLRRRAYTRPALERVVSASAFRAGEISTEGIGIELRLRKGGG